MPKPIVCFVTPTNPNAKSLKAFKAIIDDLQGTKIDWNVFSASGSNDPVALDPKAKAAWTYVVNNQGNPPVPAVIVAGGTLAASLVQNYTDNTIPVVQAAGASKPSNAGTNMTGFYLNVPGAETICEEQYDKLSSHTPVAVLYDSKNSPSTGMLSSLKAHAGSGNIKDYHIAGDADKLKPNDLKTALAGLNCNSFMLIPNALFYDRCDDIAKAVENANIQYAIYPEREYKNAHSNKDKKRVHGHKIGLTFGLAAYYVDSLLNNPNCIGDLPWQEAVRDVEPDPHPSPRDRTGKSDRRK